MKSRSRSGVVLVLPGGSVPYRRRRPPRLVPWWFVALVAIALGAVVFAVRELAGDEVPISAGTGEPPEYLPASENGR